MKIIPWYNADHPPAAKEDMQTHMNTSAKSTKKKLQYKHVPCEKYFKTKIAK